MQKKTPSFSLSLSPNQNQQTQTGGGANNKITTKMNKTDERTLRHDTALVSVLTANNASAWNFMWSSMNVETK